MLPPRRPATHLASSPAWLVRIVLPVLVWMLAPPAHAQRDQPRTRTWCPDGPVSAIAATSTTVYLGGRFDALDLRTGGSALFDVATGEETGTWPPSIAQILDGLPDGAGGWYLSGYGEFSHILPNGRRDPNFPYISDYTDSLLLVGSTLFAADSSFTTDTAVVALDPITGQRRPWSVTLDQRDTEYYTVRDMASDGSTLFIAGYFNNVNGVPRRSLAAVDVATGATLPWNPQWDLATTETISVSTIVLANGQLYVAGSYGAWTDPQGDFLLAFNATTGQRASWSPAFDGSTPTDSFGDALAVTSTTVYIAGDFSSVNGELRNNLAAFDVTTGALLPWNPNANSTVHALELVGSTVYLGGAFTEVGGLPRPKLAAVDAVSGSVHDWAPQPNSTVLCLTHHNGKLLAGGAFVSLGHLPRSNLAALDVATGRPLPWNPGTDADVVALLLAGSKLYVGGLFQQIGGLPRAYLAALDAASGAALDWRADADGYVFALALRDGLLYVGGSFLNLAGQSRRRLGAVDALSGAASTWPADSNGDVTALAVSDRTLYVGGLFASIGGTLRNALASVDAVTGTLSDWNPKPQSQAQYLPTAVLAIAATPGKVYVGGIFDTIGGEAYSNLAALDPITGAPSSPLFSADGPVFTLLAEDDTLYVGGRFQLIGGAERSLIAALDAVTGHARPWKPVDKFSYAEIYAIARNRRMTYVGGGLGYNFAIFDPPPNAARATWFRYH